MQILDKLAISVAEMAEVMEISRPTAYQILAREDCNVSFKVGTRTLVSVDALRRWIDSQTDGSVSA